MPKTSGLDISRSSLEAAIDGIPGYDARRDASGFVFDHEAAALAILWFSDCCVHVKGALAGKPIELEPWQQAIVANLFGWKDKRGLRRYREAFIYVPRKNGKSILAAGIGNKILFTDAEPGAEIYTAACEEDQAMIPFSMARRMVLKIPELAAIAQCYRQSITIESDGSFFQPINGEPDSKHGLNAHCAIIDEIHAHPDSSIIDVLRTSMGSRRQPLTVYITTADYEREGSVCNRLHDYATRVRDGDLLDARFLPVIYEAAKGDDWKSEDTWKRANPNYGISVSPEYLRAACQRAVDDPAEENIFKRLHLNIRTEQDVRAIQMDSWRACPETRIDDDELRRFPAFGGLDLSSMDDITAWVIAFRLPDNAGVYLRSHFWVPAESAEARERKDKVPYCTWARAGLLEMTEGNAIHYRAIRKRVVEDVERFDIREVAFDPWNMEQLGQELEEEDGISLVKFRQTFANFNAPTKELLRLVKAKEIHHEHHEVLTWMASNLVLSLDDSGNYRPNKKKCAEKIDGIVAAIMAIARASRSSDGQSIYEERGFLEL